MIGYVLPFCHKKDTGHIYCKSRRQLMLLDCLVSKKKGSVQFTENASKVSLCLILCTSVSGSLDLEAEWRSGFKVCVASGFLWDC